MLATVLSTMPALSAAAYEVPNAGNLTRTSSQVWTQTQPGSGLGIIYTLSAGAVANSATALTASATTVRGTPTISGGPLATFTSTIPLVTASGCTQPNILVGRWVCADQGTVTIGFSQPVTNPRIYVGRLGGSVNQGQASQRIFATEGRLTASTPAGATLTSVTGATSNLTTSTTSFGVNDTNYPGTTGDCTSDASSTGCGAFVVSGTVTSVTFALDVEIRQALLSPGLTGGSDEWTMMVATDQQFSNGPSTYNGTNGASAPFHVPSGLTLGSAFTSAGVSTTQNTTTSPTAGSATGAGDAFTATSLQPTTAQVGQTLPLSVPISGASRAGTVCGWADWNRNGVYDAGERVCTTFAAGATSAVLNIPVPSAGTAAGPLNVRFRVAFGSTPLDPTGGEDSGEVEDYVFAIKPTVSVTNSSSSTTGANFTYAITAGSQTTTVVTNGAPGATSGTKTVYNSSTYGAPDFTVTQDVTTTAVPVSVTQTQPAGNTNVYGVTYICTGATGATIATGTLADSTAGATRTITSLSIPVSAGSNAAAQSVNCAFTNTLRVLNAGADTATTAQNASVTTNVLANDASTTGNPLSPASVTVTTAPANGSTSINTTTGAITYTPAAGFVGTDSYTYRVCDTTTPNPVCGSATVTVTVTANTVTGVADSATTAPATPVSINVRANDTSATGQPLANPSVLTAPGRGSASVNTTTGAIVYTPAAGFSGVDTFTYRVCDTSGTPACSAPTTVTVTVPNQFTDGTAAAGITTPQNTNRVLALGEIATVTGAPLNPAAVTQVTPPTRGTLSINTTTGAVTYIPTPGYSGTDTFTVRVCDTSTPTVACRNVVVPVTVGPNAVTGVADSATTAPVTPVTIDVRANDTSSSGQALATPTIVTNPGRGTVTINGAGSAVYTPNAGFSGVDTFTYRVCDTSTPTPFCSGATTVTVTVPNQFTAGTAATGITTPQNTPANVPMATLFTTTGAALNPAGITVTGSPANGTVSVNTATGAITYTPTPGYTGSDSFTVQACDLSTPTPACRSLVIPVTVGGNTVTANADTATTSAPNPVTVNVRANDTSSSGQALAVPTITTQPTRGTVTVNGAGNAVYTPNAGTSGTDTFGYRVCDTSTPTPVCAASTVTVTVQNVFTNGAAVTTGITTPQNTSIVTPVSGVVTTSGAPINPAGITLSTSPARGTVSINATTGAITYVPNAGYSGSDSFALTLCDTSSPTPSCVTRTIPVTVGTNTVTAVNDSATTSPVTAVAINVRANDTTASGQALAAPVVQTGPSRGTTSIDASGNVVYTPQAGFSGVDTFTYTVCDTSTPTARCSNTATVTVSVPNQFTNGTAAAGIQTPQNTARTLAVGELVTTTGAPINPAAVTQVSAPTRGSVSINAATGAVTYTPNPGYSGSDSFAIQLCDTSTPTVACRTVTVPVTVGTNTVTAANDTATTAQATAVSIDVRSNDTSATGQPLGAPAVVTAPANGTTSLSGGTLVYTPNAGFSGVDTFTYRVCDTSTPTVVCSAPATVTVTVPNGFVDGAAVTTGVTTPQNTTLTVPIANVVTTTGAAVDPAGVTVVTAPTRGSVSINASTGAITYVPGGGYTGPDSVVLRICDRSTPTPSCVQRTVPITVQANTVVANDDTAATTPATAVTINVRANDTTASGQPLAAPSNLSTPGHGTATVDGAGNVVYTPAPGWSGVDTFTYRVCDTSTPTPICSGTATVTVTVPNRFTEGVAASGITTSQNTPTTVAIADAVTVTGAPINPAGVTVATAPAHGTVSVSTTTGVATYTPTPGYAGPDSFSLQLCDTSTPTVACRTVTIPVTVTGNTVTANADAAITPPVTAVSIDVRANDTRTTTQPLANPTVVTAPGRGTATVDAGTGRIVYTPNSGFSGVDTFTYRVCDTSTPTVACSSPATVTVTVPNAFTSGTAVTNGVTTAQNTAVTVPSTDVVTTTGAPIDPAGITVTTAPTHGTVTVNTTTGAITYTPTPGYAGTDSVVLQLCDRGSPSATCVSRTVTFTVTGNTVTARDDSATTDPVTAVAIDVRANDTSATGQPLAAPSSISTPGHGTTSVDGQGRIVYTPASGFSGVDTFTYRVCDTSTPTPSCSNPATVTVMVPNRFVDGPALSGVQTPQNTALTIPLATVVSTTGAPVTAAGVTVTATPAHGTATVNGAGAIVYTPTPGYTGADAIPIRLCDTSTPTPTCVTRSIPVAVGANVVSAADDTATTTPTTAVTIDVRANDLSTTGQALAAPTIVAQPGRGTVTIDGAGSAVYTPNPGFSGVDSFTYRGCDTSTPTPVCSNPATVTVTVPNGFTDGASVTTGVTTAQNTPATFSAASVVTTSGAAIDAAAITVAAAPAHGSITIDPTTGAITFTPTAGYAGSDSVTLRLCDASSPTPTCLLRTVPLTVGGNVVTANPDSATTRPATAVAIPVTGNDTSATGQALAAPVIQTAPGRGTVTVSGTSVVYTPNAAFSGVDTFTYRVCDTSTPTPFCSGVATVTVAVPNEFAPGGATNGVVTPQNTSIAVPLASVATTSGAPLAPAGTSVTVPPLHGSASVDTTTGVVTYIPTVGYSGADRFTVQVCDTSSPTPVCRGYVIPVTVGGNTVLAGDDSATTAPVTAVDIDVRANDTTSTGTALAAPVVRTQPPHGTAEVQASGLVRYLPAVGFSGVDSFTYTVCDTSTPTPFCSNTATVTVTVPNGFTNGIAVTNGVTTIQNQPTTIALTNIVTTSGAPLNTGAITVAATPAHGTLSINATTGAVTFTPTPGYAGADSFALQLCDTSTPTAVCVTRTIGVTVTGNTVTVADDAATTAPVTAVTIPVTGNDTSATGQPFASPLLQSPPAHGTATVSGLGVVYTPAAGFSGVDTFTYSLCDTSTPTAACAPTNATVTVTVPNRFTPGTAAAGITTPQNTSRPVPLGDLATTAGAPLSPTGVTQVTAPAHGSLSISAAGTVTYVPTPGYAGPDSFVVQVCDQSTPTASCFSVTVPVTVGGNTVTALDDSATTAPVTPVTIDVRANDTSGSAQALGDPAVIVPPTHGTTSIVGGSVVYTPAAGFSGVDTFTYRVCDTSTPTPFCSSAATVTVTVPNGFVDGTAAAGITTPQNTARIVTAAELATTTGAPINPAAVAVTVPPAHGSATVDTSTGSVRYVPTPGYTGPDAMTVQVCDQSDPTPACRSILVPITVGGNTVTAAPDAADTTPAVPVTINVRANDTSGSGQALAAPSIVEAPGHGSAVVDGDGSIVYTPATGWSGVDTFTYRVCDTSTPTPVCSSPATVTITVPNRFTPGVHTSGLATPQNAPVTSRIPQLVTVTGAPIDPAAVAQVTPPAGGSLSIAADGSVTYTPTFGFAGTDEYVVQLCDTSTPTPSCYRVRVPLTVGPNIVDAVDDTATTAPTTAVTIDVRANDITESGQPLDPPTIVTAPAGGTATVDGSGDVVYTPNAGFSGVDTFVYRVCDTTITTVQCDTATVTVTVPNAFSAGTAAGGRTTPQNTPVTIPLADVATTTGAALDPDAGAITAGPSNGSVSLDTATGAVTYTPAPGYSGPDSLTYRVCDLSTPRVACFSVAIPLTVGVNTVTAGNDLVTTRPVTPVTITVRANDTSQSGTPLAAPVITRAPVNGTAVVDANGDVVYTPNSGFSGGETFDYEVCDTSTPTASCSNTATVTVVVPNRFAIGSAASGIATPQNTPRVVTIGELATTTGAPIDPAGITLDAPPAHGSVSIDTATGEVTYTPTAGYSGPDAFDVQVCDLSDPAPSCILLTIPVTVGGNVVSAGDDVATTPPTTPVSIDVGANDTSGTGQPLVAPVVQRVPGSGTATVSGPGAISYTPDAGFSGVDTFTYTVCDDSTPTPFCSNTATVTVTVPNGFVDGAPITTGLTVTQNTSLTTPLADLLTTTGAPLDEMRVSLVTPPARGTVSIDGSTGAVTYTANSGAAGSDSVTLQFCDRSTPTATCVTRTIPITIPANVVTAVDDAVTTTPGTAVVIPVTGNDTSATGQSLGAPTIDTPPTYGTVTISGTSVVYTPFPNFSGTDSFTYTVCDTSTPTPSCSTAAAVIVATPNLLTPGDAATGRTTPQSTALVIPLSDIATVTGAPLDPDAVLVTAGPDHGVAAVDAQGAVTYTPTSGYSGEDRITVRVCDTSIPTPQCLDVEIPLTVGGNTVIAGDDTATTQPGVAVDIPTRVNDTSGSGAPLDEPVITDSPAPGVGTVEMLTDGVVRFTPAARFSGVATFRYLVCDLSTPTPFCSSPATVTITVPNTFTDGTAVTAGVTTPQNTPVTVQLDDLGTTNGAPIDTTAITLAAAPRAGSVSINAATGAVTYVPNAGTSGADAFALRLCDTSSPTPSCVVRSITVVVGGNSVVATPDAVTTPPSTSIDVDVRANDVTATGQPLGIPIVQTAPAGGVVSVDGSGPIRYTPNAGFSGVDTFTYSICDTSVPAFCSNTTIVTVTVPNGFAPGAAVAAGVETPQNTAVTVPLDQLVTTTGAPVDAAAGITVVSQPARGVVAFDPAGAMTFTPNAGASGPDQVTVRFCDTSAGGPSCTLVTVPLRVGGNVVTANPDAGETPPSSPIVVDVRANDTTATGQPLGAPVVVDAPDAGTATVVGDQVRYVPADGFSGVDTFTYRICDTSDPAFCSNTTTVTVTVPNGFGAGTDPSITTPQNTPATRTIAQLVSTTGAGIPASGVSLAVAPGNGTVTVDSGTGEVTYLPNSGFSGSDTFQVRYCDASTPTPSCTTVTVPVTVGGNVVTATDDTAATTPTVPVDIEVRANDVSATGQALGIPVIAIGPGGGTASVDPASGTVRYTPAPGFSGVDTFQYSVCDTSSPAYCSDLATVTVTVPNAFTPGPAVGGIATPQNTPVTVPLAQLMTTSGAPIDPAGVTVSTPAEHGVVSIDPATGDLTYLPAAGYSGPDAVTVQFCDLSTPTVACRSAVLPISVGVNAVTAIADAAATDALVPVVIPVRANDTTTSGQALGSPVVTTAPTGGTTSVSGGDVTYSPAPGFSGDDAFTYRICDTSTPTPVCGLATVTVTVANVFAPGAATAGVPTPQNTSVTIPLTDLATPSGRPLAVGGVTIVRAPDPALGAVAIDGTSGAVTVTPAGGVSGPVDVELEVCDTSSPTPFCTTVTVLVVVGANTVTARDDFAATAPGVAVDIPVRGNDTTASGQPLAVPTVTTPAGRGTTSVDAVSGLVTYTPEAGWSGVDTFGYRVCDTSAIPVCDDATVTVTAPNAFVPGSAVTTGVTTPQNVALVIPRADLVEPTGSPIATGGVTQATAPAHGTLSISPAGAVTYTPEAGFSGSDAFRVQLCDTSTPTAACTTVTVGVTVGDNLVTADPDAATVAPGAFVDIDVRDGDTTQSGTPLGIPTIVTAPTRGTAVPDATTGLVRYTPAAGFSGVDTFRYRVCDASTPTAVCADALVTVTVPNGFVDGGGLTATTPQNTPVDYPRAGILTTTGSPIDESATTVLLAPANGVVTIDPVSSAVTYTPDPGFSGADQFTLRYCDTATPQECHDVLFGVTVGVNAVTAGDDAATTDPATPVTLDLRANDTSASGQALGIPTIATGPVHGTVSIDPATGVATYAPAAGFSGSDAFSYEVCDTSATPVCATATAWVTVPNRFLPGSSVTTPVGLTQNSPVTIPLASVASTTGAPLDAALTAVVAGPAHGSVSIDTATGAITYTPDPGYSGSDTMTVRVCDTSTPTVACTSFVVTFAVGANTVTALDDSGTTSAGVPVVIDVLENDTSATGQSWATPAVAAAPAHGTVVAVPGGLEYRPDPGYSGTDAFGYTACDTSTPAVCDTATVTVTITTVFTPGTATTGGVDTAQNTAVSIPIAAIATVTGSPIRADGVTIVTDGANGAATVDPATGAVVYRPDPGFTGTDLVRVRLCDSAAPSACEEFDVEIRVGANAITVRPDALGTIPGGEVVLEVRANDSSATGTSFGYPSITTGPVNGTASVEADGRIRYVATTGWSGSETFEYALCDTSTPTPVCGTALVTATVANVITDGAATSGVSTPQNTSVAVPFAALAVVTGSPLDPAQVAQITAPLRGSLSIDPVTGDVTYTPAPGYAGTDRFTVRVCDTASPETCGDVTIPVTVGPNAVTANLDAATTTAPNAVDVDVRANDVSASGQLLQPPVVTTAPSGGTAVVQPSGDVRYTPRAGFSGTDSFTYRVCDTSSPTPVCGVSSATVTVNNLFTDGPAVTAPVVTGQNRAVVIPLTQLASTSGAPLDPAGVTLVGPAPTGSVAINPATGAVTYTPAPGFTGADSFGLRLCDTSTPVPQCRDVVVDVAVGTNSVDARDDEATTAPATPVTVDVVANDLSQSGQAFAAPTITGGPLHGTATVVAGGIRYTPDAGWSGVDRVIYEVCDTSPTPQCDTATLTLTVPNRFLDGPSVPPGVVETPQNTPVDLAIGDIVTTTGAPIDPASITFTDEVSGTAAVVGGLVRFTPAAGFSGDASFRITLCDTGTDATGDPSPACVSFPITVRVATNAVSANDDAASTSPAVAVTIPVQGNDVTASGQPLALPQVTTDPQHGSAVVQGDGTVVYTPVAGWSGVDTFVYTQCDQSATPVCDTATVTVTVANGFLPGTAGGTATTPQNTPVTLTIPELVTTTGAGIDPSQVTVFTPPTVAHGAVSVNTATGAVTYVPAAGYSGPDRFAVRLCDTSTPTPSCTVVPIDVTVGANTVTADDDAAATTAGTGVVIDVRAGDSSSSGQALANPIVTTAPSDGTATVQADGRVYYVPDPDFSGVDAFAYRVCDTSSVPVCDTALVTVSVANRFTDGPAAAGVATPANTPVTLPLSSVMSSAGAPLDPGSVAVAGVDDGTVAIGADGSVTFTPAAGFAGTDTVQITACDTASPPECHTVSVPISVSSNTVVANDDTAATTPGASVLIPVLGNDSSASAQPLGTPTVSVAPTRGTATPSGTQISYRPNAGFSGVDTFQYRVCDTSATPICDTATVTVTVPNGFSAGSAVAGVTTPQNTAVVIPLASIATTTGAPLDPGAVTISGTPSSGTATADPATGAVTYRPGAGFSGSDAVTVRVCDLSTPTPECREFAVPVVVGTNTVTAGADTATTRVGTAVSIPVGANDTSGTGQPLAAPTVSAAPAAGSAAVSGSSIVYTPSPGFSGNDAFQYRVCDTSTPTPVCAVATVTVRVANVLTAGAAASGVTTPEGVALPIPFGDLASASGRALDPSVTRVIVAPAQGAVTVDPVTGDLVYTPAPGYIGQDALTVRVCDGSNPADCLDVRIPIVVTGPVIDPQPDVVAAVAGQPIRIDVLANDLSYTGNPLDPASLRITRAPAHGVATVQADGSILYLAAFGYAGPDEFEYEVCDTSAPPVCATQLVTLAVASAPAGGIALTGSEAAGPTLLVGLGVLLLGAFLLLTGRRRDRTQEADS